MYHDKTTLPQAINDFEIIYFTVLLKYLLYTLNSTIAVNSIYQCVMYFIQVVGYIPITLLTQARALADL